MSEIRGCDGGCIRVKRGDCMLLVAHALCLCLMSLMQGRCVFSRVALSVCAISLFPLAMA